MAKRRSDGEYIAIQCKSRQLNEQSRGNDINKGEIDKFTQCVIRVFLGGALVSHKWRQPTEWECGERIVYAGQSTQDGEHP